MTDIWILANVIAPLALMAIGWSAAFLVGWQARREDRRK